MEVEKLKGDCDDLVFKGKMLAKWLTKYIRRRAKELNIFQRDRHTLIVEFEKVTLDEQYRFYIQYQCKYGIRSRNISHLTLKNYFDNRYTHNFYPTGDMPYMLLGRYNRKLIQIFGWSNLLIRLEERKEQIWK